MIKETLRILLVEDHPFQLKATQYLLESYGFTYLTTTHSAQDALREMHCAEKPFDILLCDQCLPDIVGIDLIRIASRQGMIKKAILLSSLSSAELEVLEGIAKRHELPLLGYLIKPLRQDDFLNLLNSNT